jgi:Flp pilus assembly pilin Flp
MAGTKALAQAKRWPLVVLASASALATVGIVWLIVQASEGLPDWALMGSASPLALKCLAIILVGSAALVGLGLVMVRLRLRRPRGVRNFRGDQGGTAAIEMALLLPFALMITLVIVQAALLFNANMVVHYAAFCAARMAVVTVPADYTDIDDEAANRVNPPEIQPSDKLERIRRAAVMALIPISHSLNSDSGDPIGPAVQEQSTSVFSKFGTQSQPWFRDIKPQYDYANEYTKIDLTMPGHWLDGDPDGDCPYHAKIYLHDFNNWSAQSGFAFVWRCPGLHREPKPEIWDYWYWEDLHVKVTYPFLLSVPYASRFLGEETTLADGTAKQFTTTINVTVTLTNEGGPEIRPSDYQPN